MDPDKALEELRSAVAAWREGYRFSNDAINSIMEAVDSLDRSMTNGGPRPKSWPRGELA